MLPALRRLDGATTMDHQAAFDPSRPTDNYVRTRSIVGYIPRAEATAATYADLGFRCGLEVHQQLATAKKLFCRCPARRYQRPEEFDAQLVRHMRPTLSELGEYDGTALMEFKTRKNIVYRIRGESACTYDIDDTPPFPLNRDALRIAIEIALLLETTIVGEIHITRKQYLDGSIPTGFQRTAIVGIEGQLTLGERSIGVQQLSIEEDSCREVSDKGHVRVFTTDRLGTPLIETVTKPELTTPDEAARAAELIRLIARSTGKVRTGIGAARQDVNVSVAGGTRVEIKGVQRIRAIPQLVHVEAYRQRALLRLAEEISRRIPEPERWSVASAPLTREVAADRRIVTPRPQGEILVVNLPGLAGTLSAYTQPGRCFADEIEDRLHVVACLARPNMTHSEELRAEAPTVDWVAVRRLLDAGPDDAQILVWGPADDMKTALETVEERCRLAFHGVPGETRRAEPHGTTCFERVLPGPDRMYPDTDAAPIPVPEELIRTISSGLPEAVATTLARLRSWGVPKDTHAFLLRGGWVEWIEPLAAGSGLAPGTVGALLGHVLRHAHRRGGVPTGDAVSALFALAGRRGLGRDAVKAALERLCRHPAESPEESVKRVASAALPREALCGRIHETVTAFSPRHGATRRDLVNWTVGTLRPLALGSVPLAWLARRVEEELP